MNLSLRVEFIIFALILIFLPINLAKHFFFAFCYVDGILVDYLIPTVYLTDILIWGLLGIWVFREVRMFRGFREWRGIGWCFKSYFVFLFSCFLVFIFGLSALFAQNQPAAVYRWLKLLEYVLFALYVAKNVDLKKDFSTIVKLLSVGVLVVSVLAIAQWFKQGSIFGYWFLGENKYTVSTPGIAILDFTGIRKARPYGTFPHPNVLGGYLAVVLPWIFYAGIKGLKGVKERGFYFLTLVLGLTALGVSFSRSAWVVGGLGLLGVSGLVFRKKGLSLFSFYSLLPSAYSLSFLRRAELNWIALKMFQDHPLLGVGLNNFTVRMSEYGEVSGWTRFLQPVHNVYLLVAAETGILGLAAFLCLLLFTIYDLRFTKPKSLRYLFFISLSQISVLCLFDHYFFTLQQTSFLFWLSVGLAFSAVDG